MGWFNQGNIIKILALLLAVLAFWNYEVKGPNYGSEYEVEVLR